MLFAECSADDARRGPSGLCYVRDSGAPRGPSPNRFRALASRRGGRLRASCPTPTFHTPGRASAPSCAARSPTPRGTSGSSRCSAQRSEARHAGHRGARRDPRLGRRPASRACCRPLHRRRARRRASRVAASSRPAGAHRAGRHRARRAARRRRPTTPSTRASRSTSSSSATPTASRTPPRWRSPRCPASPTTRSSSAGRPGSARRTCCTRSPTTSARYGDGADRPLHDGRGVHRPLRRRPPHRRDSTPSRPPTAASTSCSSTTSSSSQSKARTEQEFFHTFNALHERRRAARADLRPPAARPRRARGPPARALRGRPRRPTSARPTPPRG